MGVGYPSHPGHVVHLGCALQWVSKPGVPPPCEAASVELKSLSVNDAFWRRWQRHARGWAGRARRTSVSSWYGALGTASLAHGSTVALCVAWCCHPVPRAVAFFADCTGRGRCPVHFEEIKDQGGADARPTPGN